MKIICAIKDTAVQAFGQIFLQHTPEEAIRSLRTEVNKQEKQSPVSQHPDDHELYKIGEYNDITGTITATAKPELIVRLKDLKQG